MTTIALFHSYINKNVYSKVKSMEVSQTTWARICLFGVIMCSVLLFTYICQVNILTSGIYSISSNKSAIDEISKENKNLEVAFAENSYLEEVLSKIENSNFQKTVSIKYIHVLENSLANAK